MARWALSPIIGNGTATVVVGQEATTGPYRAKASDYGAHVAVIPGNDDGTPRFAWALVKLDDSADLTAAAADTELRLLPAWSMDKVLNAAEAGAVANALARFDLYGPDATGHTVRQVVRWIADQLDLTWSVG
jgi:hypothetical protein